MAGFPMRPTNKSLHLVSDIVFEGGILSDTRAALVTELIKYVLYERQQIPLPADQLKIRTDAFTKSSSIEDEHELNFKRRHVQSRADRKAKLFLTDLKEICDNLKRSFICCPEIDQVAILLGGTVASPMESYVIRFPPTCPDADCLPLRTCKNVLFKKIIIEDILGSLKTAISPSNITILVSAPRSHPLTWFLPKHSISPKARSIISFNLECMYLVPVCHDLSIADCDTINLSGLEALECTLCGNESSSILDENEDTIQKETSGEVCVLHHNEANSLNLEILPGTDNNLKQCSAEVPSGKQDRFCEHRRLNYIFSNKKQGKKTGSDSPLDGHHSTVCDMSSSPRIADLPCNQSNDKLYTNQTTSIFAERNSSDFLWYQSPIMLKGFKDQIDHSQTLNFV